jgi:hypothetical protein
VPTQKAAVIVDQALARHRYSPEEHEKREPDGRTQALEQDVGRHLVEQLRLNKEVSRVGDRITSNNA